MKVKIGNSVHDSEEEPIMIIIHGKDHIDMEKVDKHKTVRDDKYIKYCAYPSKITEKQLREFMEI